MMIVPYIVLIVLCTELQTLYLSAEELRAGSASRETLTREVWVLNSTPTPTVRGGDLTPLIPDVPPSQEEQGSKWTPMCGWIPLKSGFCRNWKSWNVDHWVCVWQAVLVNNDQWLQDDLVCHSTHSTPLNDCLHLRRCLSETNNMMLCKHEIWSC